MFIFKECCDNIAKGEKQQQQQQQRPLVNWCRLYNYVNIRTLYTNGIIYGLLLYYWRRGKRFFFFCYYFEVSHWTAVTAAAVLLLPTAAAAVLVSLAYDAFDAYLPWLRQTPSRPRTTRTPASENYERAACTWWTKHTQHQRARGTRTQIRKQWSTEATTLCFACFSSPHSPFSGRLHTTCVAKIATEAHFASAIDRQAGV